jgi:uncharacterized coiled-coil protein SlyX
MSLHEPTIPDLLQAVAELRERDRDHIVTVRELDTRLERQANRIAELNALLTEANGIIVRQSKELTMMCEANTRLETELATLRARGA